MSFEKRYKKWLNSLHENPPDPAENRKLDSVWNSVEEELILDKTWSGINDRLTATEAFHDDKRMMTGPGAQSKLAALLVIALIVLTTGLVFWLTDSYDERLNEAELADENAGAASTAESPGPFTKESGLEFPSAAEKPDTAEAGSAPGLKTNIVSNHIEYSGIGSLKMREFIPDSESGNDFEEKISMNESVPQNSIEQRKPRHNSGQSESSGFAEEFRKSRILNLEKQALHDTILPRFILSENTSDPESVQGSSKNSSLSKWKFHGIGVNLTFNNSWILNNETISGLNPESLIDTRISYAPEVGLSASFASGKGSRVELEMLFISLQNQRYRQYIDALYQDREISLHYRKMNIAYHFPVRALAGNIALGAYYGYLTGAEESIGSNTYMVSDSYKKNDYGLLFEYQFEFYLSPRIILAPSLRAQYSLYNTFRGDAVIPDSFNKTRNASMGFKLGIYRLF